MTTRQRLGLFDPCDALESGGWGALLLVLASLVFAIWSAWGRGVIVVGFVAYIAYFVGWVVYAIPVRWIVSSAWHLAFPAPDVCEHKQLRGRPCEACRNFEAEQLRIEKEKRDAEEKSAREQEAVAARRKREDDALALYEAESKRLRSDRLRSLDGLRRLHPREFEEEIGAMFSRMGYSVIVTPYSGDEGRDIVGTRGKEKMVAECKRYGAGNGVDRTALQRFTAVFHHEGADVGYFITTGHFSKGAKAWAEKYPKIVCVDGSALLRLLNASKPLGQPQSYRALCVVCGTSHSFGAEQLESPRNCSCGAQVGFRPEVHRPAEPVAQLRPRRSYRPYRRWRRRH